MYTSQYTRLSVDVIFLLQAADKSVSSIKEPYPFKKLRHKLKKDTSQLPETPFPNQLITPSQLEFIPLETNEGTCNVLYMHCIVHVIINVLLHVN